MDFRTAYDGDSKKFTSVSGEPTLAEYEYIVDKAGVRKLVKTDRVINVHDKIQAEYPSTDINNLMKKFALGDSSAINIREGLYFDATEMPKNYAELFNRVEESRQFFEKLDPELKAMFGNSYEQFWTEFNTKEGEDKIVKYNDRFVNHQFDIVPENNEPKDNDGKEIDF